MAGREDAESILRIITSLSAVQQGIMHMSKAMCIMAGTLGSLALLAGGSGV